MLVCLLCLLTSTEAAELRIETYERVGVKVDGRSVPLGSETHAAYAVGLGPGEHVVSIFDGAGRELVARTFQLSLDQKLRMAWIDDSGRPRESTGQVDGVSQLGASTEGVNYTKSTVRSGSNASKPSCS